MPTRDSAIWVASLWLRLSVERCMLIDGETVRGNGESVGGGGDIECELVANDASKKLLELGCESC